MINAVISDFDGVLLDLRDAHFECLNRALSKYNYKISEEDHIKLFDGLSTNFKLNILCNNGFVSSENFKDINDLKQSYTIDYIKKLNVYNKNIKPTIELLKSKNIKFVVASNAQKATIIEGLKKLDILNLVDFIISNEEVVNQKPSPEIYYKAFIKLNLSPENCLILEDSKNGRKSALLSKGHLLGFKDSLDFNSDYIFSKIDSINSNSSDLNFSGSDVEVIIPMAGAGRRFPGKVPKPFINFNDKPMIWHACKSLGVGAKYHFIVRREHTKYNLDFIFSSISKDYTVSYVDSITDGSAVTVNYCLDKVHDRKILIANCDQIINWDPFDFFHIFDYKNFDGGIVTFEINKLSNKWSYCKVNDENHVTEVKEKIQISNIANTGIFLFKDKNYYKKYCDEMIKANDRVNNEYYIAPIYNYMIKDNKKILNFLCKKFYGIGTKEDLDLYLSK